MTVTNGTFVTESADDIEGRIVDQMQAIFDDPDTTDGSIFRNIAAVYGTVLAEEQEQHLQDVFQSGFVETAGGDQLELVTDIVGIDRRAPTHATGTVTFDHNSPVTQDYSIPSGTSVQTDGTNPTTFDTTEDVEISYIDGFESGTPLSAWGGDTGNWTQTTAEAYSGSNSIQATTTSASESRIFYDTSGVADIGTKYSARFRFDSTATSAVEEVGLVAFEDTALGNEVWEIEIDEVNDLVNFVEKSDIGSDDTTSTGATIPEDEWLHATVLVQVDGNVYIDVFDSNDNLLGGTDHTLTHSLALDTVQSDYMDVETIGIVYTGESMYVDEVTQIATTANVREVDGGAKGNLGAQTLTTMSSTVAGVNDVYNRLPTGDATYTDTEGVVLTPGEDEESDEELRDRARRSSGERGGGTVDALIGSVLAVSGVKSVTLYENKTDTDNTGGGGLPEKSFEMVVSGGDNADIGQAIFDERAATSRDYGGAHGSSTSVDVSAINEQTFTVDFSRPSALNVDMTLDLVHDNNYAGDAAVRNAVVDYIGGVKTNGETEVGDLDTGDDVIVNEVENRVMDVAGVIGVDSSDSSFTPTTTTDSNGLEVVAVSDSEAAETDGTDGSITVTKTLV